MAAAAGGAGGAPKKHTLLGMGNPLLDISAHVGMDVLDKYGLKLNNAILAEGAHLPLYHELVAKHKVEYIAGGATQNSIRVAQWVAGTPGFGAYIGAIGHDEYGSQLAKAAAADGVTTYYYEVAEPTGTCAVLIHDAERSLVANLSAAEKYSKAHWDSAAIQEVVAGTDIFYSAGFFLTHSAGTMAATGAVAAAARKTYCMNLSAPFLCAFFKDQMASVMPYTDYVFGNESEAVAYAEAAGWETRDIGEIALRIAALPKASGTRPRIVVITQGADATVAAVGGVAHVFPVSKIDKSKIVDTNGAGDAFVGGFLAYLGAGRPLADCVAAGHWAAGEVIQRSGCTFDASIRCPV